MSKLAYRYTFRHWLGILALALPALAGAQVAVDESGNPYEAVDGQQVPPATGSEDIPLLGTTELESLVGPIALYPDDLLAIVLPASTFPLQVVQAKRFLENLESDPSLKPDESWDDSVVALTNYPEVVELLNDDLDWTWRLGEAVVAQQADVIAAIETFRDRAYAAGNLKSDSHQTIERNEGVIEISPVEDDVIYVPYYEPEKVVVYQPRPVYYYYPTAYPVYYYPYPAGYAFHSGFFWGVTTAFTIGWYSDSLHVFHHSYYGHPYYGYSYWDNWWYRRPTLYIHNTYYVNRHPHGHYNHYRSGDYWQPHGRRELRYSDQRIARSRYYPGRDDARSGYADSGRISSDSFRRDDGVRTGSRERNERQADFSSRGSSPGADRRQSGRSDGNRADIRFRDRPTVTAREERQAGTGGRERSSGSASQRRGDSAGARPEIRFRDRPTVTARNERQGDARSRERTVGRSDTASGQSEIRFRDRPDAQSRTPNRGDDRASRPVASRQPDNRIATRGSERRSADRPARTATPREPAAPRSARIDRQVMAGDPGLQQSFRQPTRSAATPRQSTRQSSGERRGSSESRGASRESKPQRTTRSGKGRDGSRNRS